MPNQHTIQLRQQKLALVT